MASLYSDAEDARGGDGDASLTKIRVAVEKGLVRTLTEVLNDIIAGGVVYLRQTMIRVLPPLLPTPFKKKM